MGAVWEVWASRAFHTLLVYTSACAQAAINLGNDPGNHSQQGLSPFGPGFFIVSEIDQSLVLPTGYLASFTIHSC